ncbi:MAG: sensor histidine kinase [Protaetiibacter sp.]
MRVTLLPRDAAARVITGAIAYLAWFAGAAIILLAVPVLVETLVLRHAEELIPLPLALLLLIFAAIGTAIYRMTPAVVVAYLVIASVAALVYEVVLIQAAPALYANELFLVNRPTLALVTIGVASSSALGGIAWCLLGYGAAGLVAVGAAILTGTAVRPGLGPTMVLLLAVLMYLTLFTIQARQRRKLPRFEELERATRRRAASADLARRTTAVVHDTVLNDLTVVMNAPDTLDPHTRERLRSDIDTLEGGEWMHTTSQVAVPDETQAATRNELARLASEFRWRGLTVNVTGVTSGVYIYDPLAGEALIGALRATFENVLRHSGGSTANVEIMYTDTDVTFMVSDEGEGFDLDAIDPSRLGIRDSIIGRMEAAGGAARIWSSPGAGTTVLLSVPVLEVRDPGEPSTHQGPGHAD